MLSASFNVWGFGVAFASMVSASSIFMACLGALFLVGFLSFALVSWYEQERRATRVAFGLGLLTPLPFFATLFLPEEVRLVLVALLLLLVAACAVVWLLPIGEGSLPGGEPSRRVDERDTMFARARLVPGTEDYEAYYASRPENQAGDDETRALPGLLSDEASLADPERFEEARELFGVAEALRDAVDGPVAAKAASSWTPAEATAVVKALALGGGAVDVGVTELRPYHVYSHVGRGTGVYGEPIGLEHRFALAFTVEMDHIAMGHAPRAPVVVESARQYVAAAEIAVEIAQLVRGMGYAARAHIDGNYRVIAPLVARDAGLGDIGRMGLIMTPGLGPRVRLGVVTTDMPLVVDAPSDDPSVLDFCSICRKCAEVCPSQAIPKSGREPMEDGGLRWQVDAAACFRLWNQIGTDCGRCMAVCPYSHPDTIAHNMVRWAVRRSGLARRALLALNDLFYGRRPAGKAPKTGDLHL